MSFQSVASATQTSHNIFRSKSSLHDAEWIFSKALSDCDDVFRSRQQSVLLVKIAYDDVDGIDGDDLAHLLSLALSDMSALSRRGAVLSLTAAESVIVIESHHPLEIPGGGLEIDVSIEHEARGMHIVAEMTWDQGRGPRLTLMLPGRSKAFGS